MYEKQGAPPCGELNSYIWNNCIGEIAEEPENSSQQRENSWMHKKVSNPFHLTEINGYAILTVL